MNCRPFSGILATTFVCNATRWGFVPVLATGIFSVARYTSSVQILGFIAKVRVMSTKSESKELIWFVTGAIGLLIAFFTVLYLRGERDPVAQIAFKEKRIAAVNAMRLSLAAASEAQNSAVMSTGEQDSKTFAEEARLATEALELGQVELEQLLKEHAGTKEAHVGPREAELMKRVAESLREFHQVDDQLMDLATQNSNRKAFSLAFGPAMKLLKEVDEPLSRIVADSSNFPADTRVRVLQLAGEVRVGILRIQVLLLPHIAEANDQKMDELELQLSAEDKKVREHFAELGSLLSASDKSNIERTATLYAEFETLKSEIIKLSRQNTDLRSVGIALKEKRKAMLACQDALGALEHAIRAESITSTIPSGRMP